MSESDSATGSSRDATDDDEPTVAVGEPAAAAVDAELLSGTIIGRYRVIERVGSGGMGVVYAAEDPELERRVALKLLRPDRTASDPTAQARLLAEARALARLSDPNVIPIYDVGTFTTGSGQDDVFVAMELVQGKLLREWCSEHDPPWQAIVRHYVAAARGLAAAHAAGLVHRDFKPSNVIVADGPQGARVLVMDFGLAIPTGGVPPPVLDSLTSQDGPDTAGTNVLMGTPAYMSPEQLAGADIDARSDQFSFCVALYEALFGCRPFPANVRARRVAILRAEIAAPKTMRAIPKSVRAIVVRGLCAAPQRRWPDMTSLAAALERACGPRRWPWGLALGSASAIALGVFAVRPVASGCADAGERLTPAWGDARRAEIEAAFASSGRGHATATGARVAAALDDYATRWRSAHDEACATNEPTARARRFDCLDDRLAHLQAATDALAQADASLVDRAIQRLAELPVVDDCDAPKADDAPMPDDAATRESVVRLRRRLVEIDAQLDTKRSRAGHEEARAALEEARGIGFEPIVAEAAYVLAQFERRHGDRERAVELYELAHAGATAHRLDRLAAYTASDAASIVAIDLKRLDDAERWINYADAAAVRHGLGGAVESYVAHTAGTVAYEQGRYDEARRHYERASEISASTHGAKSIAYANARGNLALVHERTAQYDRALAIHEELEPILRELFGEEHPRRALALANIAICYDTLGRYEEARQANEQALAIRKAALGERHVDVGASHSNLGLVLIHLDRFEEARAHLTEALAIWTEGLGPDHVLIAAALTNLGIVQTQLGDSAVALAHHRRALEIRRATFDDDHPEIATSLANMGSNLRRLGRYEEARAHHEDALARWRAAFGDAHPEVAAAHVDLAVLYEAQKRTAEAVRAYQAAAVAYEASVGKSHPVLARTLLALGRALVADGRPTEAVTALVDARAAAVAAKLPEDETRAIEAAHADASAAVARTTDPG